MEFDALWQEQARQLTRLAAAMGIEQSAIGDVLQDVYLAGWRKRPNGLESVDLRKCLVEQRHFGPVF